MIPICSLICRELYQRKAATNVNMYFYGFSVITTRRGDCGKTVRMAPAGRNAETRARAEGHSRSMARVYRQYSCMEPAAFQM